MSTTTRLAKKKALAVEKHEQGYVYRPPFTQQEFIAYIVSRILKDLFVSFAEQTLAGLDVLSDLQAATHASRLLEEIAQRRLKEEAE